MYRTDARSRMLRARGRKATGACAFAVAVLSAVLAPSPLLAGTYATSKSPYWKVGSYDDTLTRACRHGLFNQRKANNYNILFIGPDGQSVTGIAKKGWNLYDPKGLAPDGYTFHFFNDGYSDCRVYTAK